MATWNDDTRGYDIQDGVRQEVPEGLPPWLDFPTSTVSYQINIKYKCQLIYIKRYNSSLMSSRLSTPTQRSNNYTVTMEVMFDELPQKRAALFQTAQFNEDLAEMYLYLLSSFFFLLFCFILFYFVIYFIVFF